MTTSPTYHPPVDIVGFGKPLPTRDPAEPTSGPTDSLEVLRTVGYTLLAGVHDGQLFVRAPGITKDEALAALQEIVDALEALE